MDHQRRRAGVEVGGTTYDGAPRFECNLRPRAHICLECRIHHNWTRLAHECPDSIVLGPDVDVGPRERRWIRMPHFRLPCQPHINPQCKGQGQPYPGGERPKQQCTWLLDRSADKQNLSSHLAFAVIAPAYNISLHHHNPAPARAAHPARAALFLCSWVSYRSRDGRRRHDNVFRFNYDTAAKPPAAHSRGWWHWYMGIVCHMPGQPRPSMRQRAVLCTTVPAQHYQAPHHSNNVLQNAVQP